MRRRLAVFLTLFVVAPVAWAQGDSRLTFEADVLPILNAHCLQCHGGVLHPSSFALAGHTRPAYLDGCQSMDGRDVVTAAPIKEKVGKKEIIKWKYHWRDTKTSETHSGWLTGPRGLGHFDVTYGQHFMPPGGETFAFWLTASWAESDMPHPRGNQANTARNSPNIPRSAPDSPWESAQALKRRELRDEIRCIIVIG